MGYKVEMQLKGQWLWIVQPAFPTVADAESYIEREEQRDRDLNRVKTPYRVSEED